MEQLLMVTSFDEIPVCLEREKEPREFRKTSR
jgi:hypothetical protein